MDEFYQNYKGTWRPLTRENEGNATNTSSDDKTAKKTTNNVELPVEVENVLKQVDILNKLTEISADISTLNRIIVEQQEKIDQLLSLLEQKDAAGKKSIFGLPRR